MKDLLFGKTINEFPENEILSSSMGLDTPITQDSGNSYPTSSSDQSALYLQLKPNEFCDNRTKHGNVLPGWDFAEEEKLKLGSSNDGFHEMDKPVQKAQMKRRRFQNMASVETSINTQRKAPPEILSIKRAISLCSICQHRAPAFGQPPRKFSYKDLEYATDGFSHTNFLAEGGYGPVYKGTLPDGQVVAVKQHNLASRQQGAPEFYAEVEILSCAQHKNVVRLIGYCREGGKWLLVYEFACNRSLDSHLYGVTRLDWKSRQKVAIGVAKGLRYLHEECRGGCIIHRDLRPSNILVTHDFEAMVGDFGLARWQPDGQSAEETRIIGTLGYLAPEYTQTGQITEKADVFSFGVILLEMVSGREAIDICRNRGMGRLSEWARPVLEKRMSRELIDPHLENRFAEHELQCMMYAASMCIDENPKSRPRISQVLRILEGDEKVYSFISPFETRIAGRKSRESCTVRNSICACGNKTICRGQLVHGQNAALDSPESRLADYSPHGRRCDYEGISDNAIRRITSASSKNRSIRGTQSFGRITDMQSVPIQGHHFGKLEDRTEICSILSPSAKTMKNNRNNVMLTSQASNRRLARDIFEMPSSEFNSSSDGMNSPETGYDLPYNDWMHANNGLYQNDNNSYDMLDPTAANTECRIDHS